MIQHLGSDIVSELRSGVALTNISQCVEELVLNSLDAGSTCITVDVDICNASVDVSDNGTGIARSDLKSMGNRYFTSKCHSLRDLENAASYGYRGEAIASLSKVCEKLEIISRHKTSYRTFCKLARKGKYMGVYESTSPRSKHGTTVSAYGIFHMLPVRRKLMSSTIDLEQIRKKVVAIAIIHPEVSLMLRNKENSYTFFQTHRSVSVLSIMSQVFGCYKSKAFTPISDTFGSFKLSGYVSLEGHPNKNLQFFYLNKRLILKTKLHKVTNDMLSKGVSRTQADNPEPVLQQGNAKSPKSKTGDRYAGFVINLECPPSAYDITFDPAKTLVEFVKWDDPMLCLTQCLNEFLVKKGVVSEMATDDSATCISSNIQDGTNDCFKEVGPRQLSSQERFEAATTNANSNVDCQDEPACKKGISPSNMRWSLYSSTAKRKQEFEARENDGRKKSPRNCSTVSDKAIQIVKQTNKYDTCSYNDIANKSEITASTEAIFKCTPSTPISCCENLPTKRSSIYTVLQKFSRDSDNSLCKSSDDGRPKCTSSKYLLSYGSPSRSSKSSNGTSRRPGVTNCRNVLTRRTAMDSLRKRTLDQNLINFNQELESREGQIMLQWQKGGTPSSIQKIKKYPEITKLREASKQISIDDEVSPLISPSPDSKDSPEGKVGDVKTAGDCKIDDDSKTVGVSIGDFRTLGGFRTENDSWAFGDSRTTDVTDSIIERGSRITDSVMIGGDSRMEGYSKIQNESEMAVNSGAKGGPGRALECNRSLPRACEPTQEINALSRRNSKEVILKDQSCDPENENSIGDDIISHDDNGATVANHDGDSKSVDPEWLCQYDSCREQQLYVNIRTGNTSLENPKHGVDTAKIVTSSKRSGQTRKLHPFALHLSHNFTPWLPRNEKCASDSEEIGTGVGVMLNNWVNPVFEGDGKTIIGANSSTVSKNLVKVHSFLQPFNFTKECFKHLKVIRQVDNKFIVCHYTGSDKRDDDLLVIVDQHAAHERIRLENFTKDLYSGSLDAEKPSRIKSSFLLSPCKLFFSKHEVGLMNAFRTQLEHVGITFKEAADEHRSLSNQQQQSVIITTVPSVFLGRDQSEIRSMPPGMESDIEELVKEQIEVLLSTKGASATLPRSVVRVLNSQACHGAIRFGDVLSFDDCEDIMNELSKCDLPFQCAHGRPSMIPLINVELTKKEMQKKATRPPQVWKIRKLTTNDNCEVEENE